MSIASAADAQDCVPWWYEQPPRDGTWLYAVGKGVDSQAARDEAVARIMQRVSGLDPAASSELAQALLYLEPDDHQECGGIRYSMVRLELSRLERALANARATPRLRSDPQDGMHERFDRMEKLLAEERRSRAAPTTTVIQHNWTPLPRSDPDAGSRVAIVALSLMTLIVLYVIWKHRHPSSPPVPPTPPQPPIRPVVIDEFDPEVDELIRLLTEYVDKGWYAYALETAKNGHLKKGDPRMIAWRERLEGECRAIAAQWIDGRSGLLRCPKHPRVTFSAHTTERNILNHLRGAGGDAIPDHEAELRARMIFTEWERLK